MKIKIIIVDDHKILRDGIKALLQVMDNIELIGEASNGYEFLSLLKTVKPDIVLMDINMPQMNGIDATREALKIIPDLKVLVLSMHSDVKFYESMVQLGVSGFVLKEANYSELQQAILSVIQGKPYFSQELLLNLLKIKHNSQVLPLNQREKDVLALICKGFSTNEIADKLHLSGSSIEKYRAELLVKTGCDNAIGLVVFAIKNELVEI
jgi:DNA-binding NarL/FixJ family response regulator